MERLLITDREASQLLGISRSMFHTLVARGAITRIKIGRAARYRRADVVAFTERNSTAAGPSPKAAG